ncbi:dachshund homolog 1-like isoform X3 [Limulus polyphemus]|uniref:Dachshund homolog 1-like isoform X3 n=1 Tax=Limulus polyphemus TaxID=6850 RepID=A0ABM1RZA7_LIMPO|nr:dachshund homolog 1-like isoform X3 [Limulus polyphemus]
MEGGSTTSTYMSGHLPPGAPLTKTDEDILRDAYQLDQNLPNVPGGSPPPGQTLTNSSASGSLSLASEASPPGHPALAEVVFSQYSPPCKTVSARDDLSPEFHLAPSTGSRTFNYGVEATLSSPSAVVEGVQECRLIDFHGAKLAAFRVNGEDLLCLPQAFDLFLKHLVGGLHTVYTKLKRLDITPIVCNVEQVRLLRGLGAIQPGVNRCKLLSCKDFEVLYRDCTTARYHTHKRLLERLPGRPPKRTSMVGLSNNSTTGLKKGRIEDAYDGDRNVRNHRDKPIMHQNNYNHHIAAQAAVAAANGVASHLNPFSFMAQVSHSSLFASNVSISSNSHSQEHRNDASGSKDRNRQDINSFNRLREDRPPELLIGHFKTYNRHNRRGKNATYLNGATGNAHLSGLNLSQTSGLEEENTGRKNDLKYSDDYKDDDDIYSDDDYEFQKNEDYIDSPDVSSRDHFSQYDFIIPVASGFPSGPGESSIETLLRNIQGLLKVAADNARHQDRQVNLEKAELKMEIVREKELRDNLEKQLLEEQKIRLIYQKRLKKERRTRRRLHEQFQVEVQKRTHCEEAFRNSSVETLRLLNESLTDNVEKERNTRNEIEKKIQDSSVPISVGVP